MQFDILTIFPEMFDSPMGHSILARGIKNGLLKVNLHDIRAYAKDKHHSVDDTPYGGGAGMVMRPDVVVEAVEGVERLKSSVVVMLSASGERLTNGIVKDLVNFEQVIVICGRYEGIDQRVNELVVDREISIGDYVLSGGEPAAWVLVDTISRRIAGVLGNVRSTESESYETGLLEYPQYTKPPIFRDKKVPDVLMSGNHKEIEKFRLERSIERTGRVRPDLYKKYQGKL